MGVEIEQVIFDRFVAWAKNNEIPLSEEGERFEATQVSAIRDARRPRLVFHAPMYKTLEVNVGSLANIDAALKAMGYDPDNLPVGLGGPPPTVGRLVEGLEPLKVEKPAEPTEPKPESTPEPVNPPEPSKRGPGRPPKNREVAG